MKKSSRVGAGRRARNKRKRRRKRRHLQDARDRLMRLRVSAKARWSWLDDCSTLKPIVVSSGPPFFCRPVHVTKDPSNRFSHEHDDGNACVICEMLDAFR